ncbi:LacI family DNA-binding transcriptional regulator [Caproicibacter sp.]|uniref:LacI family DNA-binding transcriptional regulator n=1 Tax=Caproicibacter sp. TaxID=2814884 RepID=UPI003989D318
MATLKDVARLACVDVSTASRALNNTSYVHPDTKARVYAAVKKLSYHPNLLAKGLRQGKRHTIGVVVPTISLSVFAELTQGIEIEARKLGYETVICNTMDDPIAEKECLDRLRNGFEDGLIIASTGENNHLLRDIRGSGISIVQVVRDQNKHMSSVVTDYHESAYKGIKYLVSKGCRHIGLINGSKKIIPYLERYNGYHDALAELGYEENVAKPSAQKNYYQDGYDGTNRLLDQNPNLDGIMTATDVQGIGVIRALKERGVAFPEQVKIMSLTGHCIGGMLETSMTSIEMPSFEMGQKATQILVDEMNADPESIQSVQHIVYHASLVERETT